MNKNRAGLPSIGEAETALFYIAEKKLSDILLRLFFSLLCINTIELFIYYSMDSVLASII